MQQAVNQFPMLEQADFVTAIEQGITQAPPQVRPALEQRLGWLRQIARGEQPAESKPRTGLLGRLFGKKGGRAAGGSCYGITRCPA